jgi:hypothetical protein
MKDVICQGICHGTTEFHPGFHSATGVASIQIGRGFDNQGHRVCCDGVSQIATLDMAAIIVAIVARSWIGHILEPENQAGA